MSLIQVSNLTFAYEGSHENIFENVSFQIDTNWRLGFVGRNGRGKTTFLNLLLGKYDYQGSISASVTFSYFPYSVEDKAFLPLTRWKPCTQNMNIGKFSGKWRICIWMTGYSTAPMTS